METFGRRDTYSVIKSVRISNVNVIGMFCDLSRCYLAPHTLYSITKQTLIFLCTCAQPMYLRSTSVNLSFHADIMNINIEVYHLICYVRSYICSLWSYSTTHACINTLHVYHCHICFLTTNQVQYNPRDER